MSKFNVDIDISFDGWEVDLMKEDSSTPLGEVLIDTFTFTFEDIADLIEDYIDNLGMTEEMETFQTRMVEAIDQVKQVH